MKMQIILAGLDKDAIQLLNELSCQYSLIGYTDNIKRSSSLEYLGTDEEFLSNMKSTCGVVIPIDSYQIRRKLHLYYKQSNFYFPNLISKHAEISNLNISKSQGLIIQNGVYISPDVQIGNFVKLNVGSKVFHDSFIGDFTTLAPGATVLGSCIVQNDCFLGANCTIRNGVSVESQITVGMGSVVTKSLSNKNGKIFAGNPANLLNVRNI